MDYPLHLGMPIENFHLLPRSEGWNYCYQNGIAHVTPARILVDYSLDLTAFTHPRYGVNHARVDYRPPRQEERTRLGELFVESFRDTIDFAGYPESIFATWANDFLTRFFSPTNSEMAPNSLLAFDPSDGQLLAGALLNSSSCGEPLLDALFVGSGHRHQGIATSLASPVAALLKAKGYRILLSRVMLGNTASASWHRRFGFREIPSPTANKHRALLARERIRCLSKNLLPAAGS